MNKELEALERIIEGTVYDNIYTKQDLEQDTDIVRQALQRLESIDNAKFSKSLEDLKKVRDFSYRLPMVQYLEMNYALDTIQDALVKAQEQEKVLEIIKEKNVDVFKLYNCKTVKEYNQAQYRDCKLTEEEFELLKRYCNGNI